MQNTEIWFWQPLVTPHMTGLARALVAIGYTVHYVCPELLSDNRRMLGWSNIDLGAVRLHVIEDTQQARLLVSQSSAEAEHICSGFRVNRIFGDVQTELARLGRKHWVIIEQVREMHWYHFLKRPLYRLLIQRNQPMLKGILAIGADTADWLQARGANPDSIYPFTYFIESPYSEASFQAGSKHQVLFIGEMIPLKKLDLLIDAMEPLKDELQLIAIGSGPCRDQWQEQARKAGIDSQWPGPVPHEEIGNYLARGSCLVLPSEHDGWGVVVSESMMMGTPAICSHRCGAAAAVRHAPLGGVFESGNVKDLRHQLIQVLSGTSADARARLRRWSQCLGDQSGALFLEQILNHAAGTGPRPVSPWEAARQ